MEIEDSVRRFIISHESYLTELDPLIQNQVDQVVRYHDTTHSLRYNFFLA